MSRLNSFVQIQTLFGEPVSLDGIIVTPQSRALSVRWPYGGWVWNRPVAVLVEQGDRIERLPIVDVTRLAQVVLVALGLVVSSVTLAIAVLQRRW
jgi:hypothetical protein